MGKARIFLWDNLKFVAMICIVVLHSSEPYKDVMPLFSKYICPFLNNYSMVMFAIISGFWYKDKSFREMAILYLWPCVLFSIINNIVGSNSHYVTMCPGSNYWAAFSFKPGPAMWYLMALFLFAIATKWIRKYMSATTYLLIACVVAALIGFLPIPNRFFDIHRISSLFPVFVFGLCFRQIFDNHNVILTQKKGIYIVILILCVLYNLFVIRYRPGMQGILFKPYGLNLEAALGKWIMMIVRVVACVCIIFLMPNKEYWFTKYGSRTMNVYLLHDSLIFLIYWGVLYNCHQEWYGLLCWFIGVPLLCVLLFSTPVDKFMKKVLFLDYLKSRKNESMEKEIPGV